VKKFFESGGAFMVVAMICIATGLISENGVVFTAAGVFWLIMAIIAKGKYAKKKPPEDES
jgi:hypothetical protein